MTALEPLDLDALRREREPRSTLRPPRRRLRVLLPLALLLAFGAVLAWSSRDFFGGARRVQVARPVPVADGDGASAAPGAVVARAAGWIEPDPFALRVVALTSGVVREMLVQEAAQVAAGDPIALLVDEDARLAVERARASRDGARAERDVAAAEASAARASFDAALELTERERSGAARVDGRRAEAEHRAQAVAKGRALLTVAQEELEVQRELAAAGAAGPRQVELAAARVDEARGELAILEADAALAAADAREAEAVLERVQRDRELRIEDKQRVESAAAALALAEAALRESEARLAEAELALERTTVRAPAAGVVLERLATVGSELAPGAAAVATLYDPRSVRVRVDVPQQDLAALFVGQEARIESDARSGLPYRGEVLRVVRRADIQKVTLQAHVRVQDGDELLRPEMLVQVQFLAPAAASGASADSASVASARVAIPARLVFDGSRVWTLDPERDRAVARTLRLGARLGELVIVEEGLDLSTKLIDADPSTLAEGARVVAEER